MTRVRRLIAMTLATVLLAGCEKYALDRQMEELCKKDGGIRVHETVKLPASMFNQDGDPFPGSRAQAIDERLGAAYRFVDEITYLKRGEPMKGEGQLDKSRKLILRKSDNKILGESISYGRSGGDFIAFGHFTSKSCPVSLGGAQTLLRAVFVKEGI